jgi:DegV family protein with EDD domain
VTDRDTIHIDGDTLAIALMSGIHRVISQQEYLNRINVFPVADSDTGTNLSLSLSSALGVLANSSEKHLGTMLASTADTLLDGARGNSGAIIAQFFQGVSDSAGEVTRFTTYTFAKAVKLGAEYAHDALSEPREGTILTVITAFADSITFQASQSPESPFSDIIEHARLTVDEAVSNTPKQLEVLRKAGVVDAGAKGFAELVAGIADYLSNGHITPMPDTALLQDIEPAVDFSETDNASHFRFCTECLITAPDIDRRKLREALTKLGDSLVLAGSKHKAKVHIHVDDPEMVFEVARNFGEVVGQKADDMHRQQSATHDSSRSFAVITDSGADICDEDMERLDIHMVPCRIQFGDRGYLDKVSITTEEFYDELSNNPHHPTTSQPAPGDFRRQFQFLASHFSDVVSINLTSGASGTYQGAVSATRRCNAPGRIHVVDSLNASTGQGQLAVFAAECAAAGISVEDTLKLIETQIPKTKTFALLKDMRYAVRGGRLPKWVKTIAGYLRLMPIIRVTDDGRVGLAGSLFGYRNRITRFGRYVASKIPAGESVEIGIGQAICPEDAEELAQVIRDEVPLISALKISSLGTAIGVHGGPGTLIVSFRPSVSADDVSVSID